MKKIFYSFLIVLSVSLLFLTACESSNNIEVPSVWNNENAYAYATELGYEGTLEEFIAQISGIDGIGINDICLNEEGELVIKLTDDSEINLGCKITGVSGFCNLESYLHREPIKLAGNYEFVVN